VLGGDWLLQWIKLLPEGILGGDKGRRVSSLISVSIDIRLIKSDIKACEIFIGDALLAISD
jgi:hypothetical protein